MSKQKAGTKLTASKKNSLALRVVPQHLLSLHALGVAPRSSRQVAAPHVLHQLAGRLAPRYLARAPFAPLAAQGQQNSSRNIYKTLVICAFMYIHSCRRFSYLSARVSSPRLLSCVNEIHHRALSPVGREVRGQVPALRNYCRIFASSIKAEKQRRGGCCVGTPNDKHGQYISSTRLDWLVDWLIGAFWGF